MAKTMRKRCPVGSRKHPKSGKCKTHRKRCPNGTRKHATTGRCHKK